MRKSSLFLLYILAAFFLLCGCRASKNAEHQVERDYSGDWLRLSRQMDSLRADFQLSRRQVTDKLSNLKLEHVTTYYTPPDSTGKQYPVYVSTTKADKGEHTTKQSDTDLNATIRRLELCMDSLFSVINAAMKQEQKVAEVSWWDRHKGYTVGAAFVLVLAVIGYLVYKFKNRIQL